MKRIHIRELAFSDIPKLPIFRAVLRKLSEGATTEQISTMPPPSKLTEEPCPRCLDLAKRYRIRPETVQRLPAGAGAPLARDRSGPCCLDCASADTLTTSMNLGLTFEMARIAVGNDRQEQYRMPGLPMGLVQAGFMRASRPGDMENQHAWLDRLNWFDIDRELSP
jgi:hypothetical protein